LRHEGVFFGRWHSAAMAGALGWLAAMVSPAYADDPARFDEGFRAVDRGDAAQAVTVFSPAADKGDPLAVFGLGYAYLRIAGPYCAPDCEAQGVRLITRAAEMGEPRAEVLVAWWYEAGGARHARDPRAAADWYERAAAQDDIAGIMGAAKLRTARQSPAFEGEKALRWYHQAADTRSNFVADFALGRIYEKGDITPKDPGQSTAYYCRSADLGFSRGAVECGYALMRGSAGAIDYSRVKAYFDKAAAKSEAGGYFGLAYLYFNGLGVARDFGRARDNVERTIWAPFEDGVDFGDNYRYPKSQAFLMKAAMLEDGRSYGKNPKLARTCTYTAAYYGDAGARAATIKAADEGSAQAQYTMALITGGGRDGPPDAGAAFRWTVRAAGQGQFGAMTALASAYEQGYGTARNDHLAYVWYGRAKSRCNDIVVCASVGDAYAASAKRLTRDERAAAEAEVRDWQAVLESGPAAEADPAVDGCLPTGG